RGLSDRARGRTKPRRDGLTGMQPIILKRAQVHLEGTAVNEPRAPFASAASGSNAPPGLSTTAASIPDCAQPKKAVLVEHAGRPRAIEITCSCGETTLIELVFPDE